MRSVQPALLTAALLCSCATTDEPAPGALPAHLDQALTALRAGQPELAESEVMLALKADPRSARAHGLYASLLAERGHAEQAIVGFQRSLALDPTSAGALYGLGTLYLRQGDFLRAARHLERAVELRSEHPPSFNNLAKAYFYLGLPELAGASYEEALALDPENRIARESLDLLRRSAAEEQRSNP